MANLSPDSTVENPAGTTPARAWWTKAWKRLPLIIRALRLSWQAAPRLTLFWLVLLAAAGLLPAATVRVTRRLIDAVAARTLGGDPQASPRWPALCHRFATATRLEVGFWDMGFEG